MHCIAFGMKGVEERREKNAEKCHACVREREDERETGRHSNAFIHLLPAHKRERDAERSHAPFFFLLLSCRCCLTLSSPLGLSLLRLNDILAIHQQVAHRKKKKEKPHTSRGCVSLKEWPKFFCGRFLLPFRLLRRCPPKVFMASCVLGPRRLSMARPTQDPKKWAWGIFWGGVAPRPGNESFSR